MKRLVVLLVMGLLLSSSQLPVTRGLEAAAPSAARPAAQKLKEAEKAVDQELAKQIPPGRVIDTEQFKKIYDEVGAGERDAYLVDLRSHAEFYAGHIEGTSHIDAGRIYTIVKAIKDPEAEIIIWCRTGHRARYNAGYLYRYGYKNVWVWKGGIVDWIAKGHPLVNQFMGKFKVIEYHKNLTEHDAEGRPLWRVRAFHPY